MSRYIEADKVLMALRLDHKDVIYIDKNDTAKRIEKIPSIDIVRCKECKYWDTKWIPSGEDDDVHWCSWKDLVEYGDWFCADGERKESK